MILPRLTLHVLEFRRVWFDPEIFGQWDLEHNFERPSSHAARTVLTSYYRDTEFEVLIALFQIALVSTFQNGSKLEYIYLLCFKIYDV